MTHEPDASSRPSRSSSRLILVLLTLSGSALWLGCGDRTGPPAVVDEAAPVVFRNADVSIAYVGSESCRECHTEQFKNHTRGRHAHSFGDLVLEQEPLPSTFHHLRSGLSFDMGIEDGRMVMREYLPGADGGETIQSHVLQSYLGSGAHQRVYVAELDGFQVPAPIVRFGAADAAGDSEGAARWGITPENDRPDRASFDTVLAADCLACHVGRVERQHGRLHIREQAIGCESCHGAGALHVKHWADGRSPEGGLDDTIANPARMTRRQAMDVCNRCHVTGHFTVPVAGRRLEDWRPGLLLRDFRLRFGGVNLTQDVSRRTYADQLRASACFQGSPQLSCMTCHDDHEAPTGTDRKTQFRSRCVSCHDSEAGVGGGCGLALPQRLQTSPDDNCVLCHMPRADTYKLHMPSYDHRIAVHEASVATAEPADAKPEFEAIDDVGQISPLEHDRLFGFASLIFSWLPNLTVAEKLLFLDQAGTLLERAVDAGMDDPLVSAALALVYHERKQEKRYIEAAETALRSQEHLREDLRVSVLRMVVNSRLAGGEFERVRSALEQLLLLRRSNGGWLQMGVLARAQDDKAAGVRAAEKMLEVGAQSTAVHWDAAELFRWAGKKEQGEHHAKLGQRLEDAKERNR